ncbi:GLPGLI family protein [Kaistella daneshvariae]|uniref:GLPGLI family protein n=1 Tax=Kaistella daneshvariae TaxID=2487074 RepID=A0ABN5T1T4_9FLAO|nr:GLPGLI family protein [Kaistella daneshvariae]AZI67350.1 GLPGLI family protein [Kaistella daneshvariae]
MKKFAAVFLFFSVLSSAQNQRFMYDYTFVKDTLDKSNVTKELMYLDISKDGSKFYSRAVFVQDSTMYADFEKQIKNTGAMNVSVSFNGGSRGIVKDKILKNYPKQEVILESRVGRDLFHVAEDRKLNWKILPEKMKIGEFEAQKATTTFAGREWTAFFAPELPFQDGPYKFQGLPGLIVKLEDDSKTHVFELKGVTKYTPAVEVTSQFNSPAKPLAVNRVQYKKMFWDRRNDPAKDMKQLIASGGKFIIKDKNGVEISPATRIKEMEQGAKEANAKDNNLIEIDMLKL